MSSIVAQHIPILPLEVYIFTSVRHDFGISFFGWSYCIMRDGKVIRDNFGGASMAYEKYDRLPLDLSIITKALTEVKAGERIRREYVRVHINNRFIYKVFIKEQWKDWEHFEWTNSKDQEIQYQHEWKMLFWFFRNKRYSFTLDYDRNAVECSKKAKLMAEQFKLDWRGTEYEREYRPL